MMIQVILMDAFSVETVRVLAKEMWSWGERGEFLKNRQFANSLEKVPLAEGMFLQKVI